MLSPKAKDTMGVPCDLKTEVVFWRMVESLTMDWNELGNDLYEN
jgi:hypothetical protein